jgi:antitoxin component of MazEF toxin-antitoxin module
MTHVTVGKWGNNLAVRLPGEIVQAFSLRDGERVDMATENGNIVIRRTQPPIDLDALFQGTPQNEWQTAYADAYDWGPDLGRETVPE